MLTVPATRAPAAEPGVDLWAAPGHGGPGAALARLLRWPRRALRARRELGRLGALDDHELRDIGLFRHDLRGATALPPGEDPTRHLAALVRERRAAAGQRMRGVPR